MRCQARRHIEPFNPFAQDAANGRPVLLRNLVPESGLEIVGLFVVLEHQRIRYRSKRFQGAADSRLLPGFQRKRVIVLQQVANLAGLVSLRFFHVRHGHRGQDPLLHGIADPDHAVPAAQHVLQVFFTAELKQGQEGSVQLVIFHLALHRHHSHRQKPRGKVPGGSLRPLQPVGIEANRAVLRKIVFGKKPFLFQPQAEILAHSRFQHGSAQGQFGCIGGPLEPLVRRQPVQQRPGRGQRRADIMPAQHHHPVQRVGRLFR